MLTSFFLIFKNDKRIEVKKKKHTRLVVLRPGTSGREDARMVVFPWVETIGNLSLKTFTPLIILYMTGTE
jgi:hypothetical protein